MSAKHTKKGGKRPAPAAPAPSPAAPRAAASSTAAEASAAPASGWLDSTDPRKRTIGKVVLAGVWVYVAALWLLALDQTFDWGIFGPKTPPLP